MNVRPYRSNNLVQWNARQCIDNPQELVDKVVEAVMHQQGIEFEHTDEYRSVYSYDKLWEQLEHYSRTHRLDKNDSYLQYGVSNAFRIFACPSASSKLSPVSLVNTVQNLLAELGIKGDKAAGLTAYGESKLEAFTIGLDKALSILLDGKAPSPCLAGVRTQRKGKTRLIWAYPLEMTIIEAVVMRPLINFFKGASTVMAFGDYSHEIGQKLRRCATETKQFYGLDYSQFDSTVSIMHMQYFFNAMRTWFNLEDEIYPNVTVAKVFDVIESYAITAPIVMPKRGSKYPVMVTGLAGGVRSGSYCTQMCDSFTAVALGFSISMRFNLKLNDNHILSLGDDFGFFCNNTKGEVLLNEIAAFVEGYGFKINRSKCETCDSTQEFEFLGRKWRNGFPLRTMQEIARGALYPERHRSYNKKSRAARQKQALNVIGSYLLTGYLTNPTCDTDLFNHVYFLTENMTSGYSEYLLKEGLIPGDVLERAVY